jgi:hypothetical protein
LLPLPSVLLPSDPFFCLPLPYLFWRWLMVSNSGFDFFPLSFDTCFFELSLSRDVFLFAIKSVLISFPLASRVSA